MPTRFDKEFKQNIINLYKQGESAYIQGIKKRIKYRLIFVKAKIRKFLRVFIGTSNVEKLRKGYRKRFGH